MTTVAAKDLAGRDPVCGMQLSTPPAFSHEYDGQAYGFCSQHCHDRFVAEPQAFAGSSEGACGHGSDGLEAEGVSAV